jgi:hypothetical protein
MGLQDLIQMAQITEDRKKAIFEACFEIKVALVQAEKAATPLIEEIRAADQLIADGKITTQAGGNVVNVPRVLTLENAKVFLKFGKEALFHLAEAMTPLLEQKFDGPHFHTVLARAKKVFGPSHPATKLLESDQQWIKNFLGIRNEDEHPKSGKPFVSGYNIRRRPQDGKFLVRKPYFYNDLDVHDFLDASAHNLLTFAEELIALSLTFYYPPVVTLAEIPKDKRRPEMPIRFRLTLKDGAFQPKPSDAK